MPLWCRFREDAEEEEGHHEHVQPPKHAGRCPVPERLQGSPSYDLQLGFELPSGRIVTLPWRNVSGK